MVTAGKDDAPRIDFGERCLADPRIAGEKAERKLEFCGNTLLREIRVELQGINRILQRHLVGEIDLQDHIDELRQSRDDIRDRVDSIQKLHQSLNYVLKDALYEVVNLWQLAEKSRVFDVTSGEPGADEEAPDAAFAGSSGQGHYRPRPPDPDEGGKAKGRLEQGGEPTRRSADVPPAAKTSGGKGERPDEQKYLREINLLNNRVAKMLFYIAYLTGKERINNWLQKARPGYALPFHRIFEDELESVEERQKILNLYSVSPKSFDSGWFDASRGVVICSPKSPWIMALRFFVLVAVFALCTVLAAGLGWKVQDLPGNTSTSYGGTVLQWIVQSTGGGKEDTGKASGSSATGDETATPGSAAGDTGDFTYPDRWGTSFVWAALIIGIFAHVLIAGAKRTDAEFRQFPLPMGDWFIYLSARTSALQYKLVLALLVFAAALVGQQGQVTLLDAFLIGYGFDSVVELLGTSMENTAGNRLAAYKQKLGLSP